MNIRVACRSCLAVKLQEQGAHWQVETAWLSSTHLYFLLWHGAIHWRLLACGPAVVNNTCHSIFSWPGNDQACMQRSSQVVSIWQCSQDAKDVRNDKMAVYPV